MELPHLTRPPARVVRARVLSEKTPAIWLNLGFSSRNQFCITAKRIKELRNLLAHGNDLLALDANPVEAIKVFVTIRDMAEKAWVVVQSE